MKWDPIALQNTLWLVDDNHANFPLVIIEECHDFFLFNNESPNVVDNYVALRTGVMRHVDGNVACFTCDIFVFLEAQAFVKVTLEFSQFNIIKNTPLQQLQHLRTRNNSLLPSLLPNLTKLKLTLPIQATHMWISVKTTCLLYFMEILILLIFFWQNLAQVQGLTCVIHHIYY
ncbi:hypothetical protein ACJX0J_019193 [Zea mays]